MHYIYTLILSIFLLSHVIIFFSHYMYHCTYPTVQVYFYIYITFIHSDYKCYYLPNSFVHVYCFIHLCFFYWQMSHVLFLNYTYPAHPWNSQQHSYKRCNKNVKQSICFCMIQTSTRKKWQTELVTIIKFVAQLVHSILAFSSTKTVNDRQETSQWYYVSEINNDKAFLKRTLTDMKNVLTWTQITIVFTLKNTHNEETNLKEWNLSSIWSYFPNIAVSSVAEKSKQDTQTPK